MSYLHKNNFKTLGIGKISDLFGEEYLDSSIHTEGDKDGFDTLIKSYKKGLFDFYFINLVDLDMLYGHREDPVGYYEGLKIIDKYLEKLIEILIREGTFSRPKAEGLVKKMRDDGFLILGNDYKLISGKRD